MHVTSSFVDECEWVITIIWSLIKWKGIVFAGPKFTGGSTFNKSMPLILWSLSLNGSCHYNSLIGWSSIRLLMGIYIWWSRFHGFGSSSVPPPSPINVFPVLPNSIHHGTKGHWIHMYKFIVLSKFLMRHCIFHYIIPLRLLYQPCV